MTIKTELQIRKKAMMDEKFPSQEIIDEFLDDPDPVSTLQLDWGQPNIVKFVVSCLPFANHCFLQKV